VQLEGDFHSLIHKDPAAKWSFWQSKTPDNGKSVAKAIKEKCCKAAFDGSTSDGHLEHNDGTYNG